jgi:transposase-like protein
MPYCPECGGEMGYDPLVKRYNCKSCGLSLTYQELIELRDKLRDLPENKEEMKKRRRKEYLNWWFSKKG